MQGYINKDFKWSEFIKSTDKPSQEVLDNIKRVAYVLSIYKHKLFNGQPITITSGYRSLQDHLRIYKEKGITDKSKIPMGSYHLKGLAADFVVKGFTIAELYLLMDLYHFGGVERTNGNWQHIDLRNKICRFTPNGTIITSHYNLHKHNLIFRK